MTPAAMIKALKRQGKPVPESLLEKHRAYMRTWHQKHKRRKRARQKAFVEGRFMYHSIKVSIPAWWLVGGK